MQYDYQVIVFDFITLLVNFTRSYIVILRFLIFIIMNKIVKRKKLVRGYTLHYIALILVLIIFANTSVRGQNEIFKSGNGATPPRHEVKDDDYSPAPQDQQQTSPAYKFDIPGFTVVQVNVDELGMNILNDAGNEPSIAFDPNNPNIMVIGWRQFDNINNNFRQAGNGYTTDGGASWTSPEVIDQGIFRSDPVLDSDADGNFYYNALTYEGDDYWCDVFKSTDGGATWVEGVYAQGGDKQWMTIDKSGGIGSGNIYAFWNVNYSICDPGFFTRSVDGGLSYEACTAFEGEPYWGTTAVSGEGVLYTCGATWWGDFIVNFSSTAQNGSLPMEWDSWSTVNLGGEVIGWGGYECPNPTGILGQVYISVDSSGGPTHGNVYLLASVQPYSGSDPMDVMIARSADGGYTWSDPVRVNDDPTTDAWQWFGTMSVAPNGRIDVVWLDTRDNPGTFMSVLYYAYSMDAGDTWSENFALSESFDPHLGWPSQDKMGDYYEMFSDESGAHLAWAATFNGEQDVYYSHITLPASPSITIEQTEFMDLFAPGNQIDMIEGESEVLIDIGQTEGPNVYDFSFVDLQNYYTVTNYEVSQITELISRYSSNATLFGEDTQTIYGSPLFYEVPDSTYFLGETAIEDIYRFAHYQPAELFSGFPMSFSLGFSQDFDIYDTTYNTNWQIESTEMYSETVNVTVDGYGTLLVGELSYECLRMKREYLTEEYKEFLYATKDGVLFVVSDIDINEPDTGLIEADYQVLLKSDIVTGLANEQLDKTLTLEQNFPNPFKNRTTFEYSIERAGIVSLKVFDITGREVAVLINEEQSQGNHQVIYDASGLKSGLYYYRLEHRNNTMSKKLMILE